MSMGMSMNVGREDIHSRVYWVSSPPGTFICISVDDIGVADGVGVAIYP